MEENERSPEKEKNIILLIAVTGIAGTILICQSFQLINKFEI